MSDQQVPIIRPISPIDMQCFIQLCAEHAQYEDALYNPQNKEECLFHALFSDSPRLYAWVIEQHGKLVGYATATLEFSTWDADSFLHMDCLYIREEMRGEGFGPLLIKEIVLLARKHNCVNVQWQTPIWNKRAIQFYQRLGAASQQKVRFFLSRDAFAKD